MRPSPSALRLSLSCAAILALTGCTLPGMDDSGTAPSPSPATTSPQITESSDPGQSQQNPAAVLSFRPVVGAVDSLGPMPADTGSNGEVDEATWQRFLKYDCSGAASSPGSGPAFEKHDIACDTDEGRRYLLGGIALDASDVDEASAVRPDGSAQWAIDLDMTHGGAEALEKLTKETSEYNDDDPRKRFAIMADQKLLVAPLSQAVVTDGKARISGNLTEASATEIADAINAAAD